LTAFADTSFLASLYIVDVNSHAATAAMPELSPPILITPLVELELRNAILLRKFRRQIAAEEERPFSAFRADLEAGIVAVRPIAESAFAEALRLSARWTPTLGARSLDILQVASAIVLSAELFLTFDDRQKKLAKAAGLVCI